jgi:hypothetical protein
MSAASVIAALGIPADARVDQRVAKKLLVENGAPTASDKRQINDGIEDLIWVAALKPGNIGVPAYKDDSREYLEIAVLHANFKPAAKASRLTELIHRAIPYPVFLIQSQAEGCQLSLAHLRWSQGQAGQTVLDGSVISARLNAGSAATDTFLASLNLTAQPRQNLHALYQGWIETFAAHAAAQHTGSFVPATDAATAERRRVALAEHERLTREMAGLRARAAKEKQLNRRVEINLQLQQLESRLSEARNHF